MQSITIKPKAFSSEQNAKMVALFSLKPAELAELKALSSR
ncbi:hypothetical protein ALQ64_02820 [Pseudomonas cannabina]|uniref:Uncharacterized protein n=1 Tax=Pseudomonas cannabina TaxID=86840 RepID=A0A3M3KDV2_PSECA|nr:hypothetical protein ALQ64_02820 [Pseudomonas cannabina]